MTILKQASQIAQYFLSFFFLFNRLPCSAAKVRNAGSIRVGLLFPDPPSHPQLQLLPVTAREEQGHVPLDDEPVVAIPDLPVTVSDAPRHPLPDHLAPSAPNLQAVAVVLGLSVVAHEPEEGDVHGRHAQLESLEVQAEVLAEAAENLEDDSVIS